MSKPSKTNKERLLYPPIGVLGKKQIYQSTPPRGRTFTFGTMLIGKTLSSSSSPIKQ